MEEYKEGEFCYGGGKAVTTRKQAVAIALKEWPRMGAKTPSKTGGSGHRSEAKTGSDAIRKDKDGFRIVFPEGRGWCTSPDGRWGDPMILFGNPRASTNLFSKEGGSHSKAAFHSLPLVPYGTVRLLR